MIELIGCQACHEPHGGDGAAFLRQTGNALCRSCHDRARVDLAATDGEVTILSRFRMPVREARRMASIELTRDGTAGHPVVGHRVSGVPTEEEVREADSTFEGEMSCLTCHDPHKGPSALILRWGASTAPQACLQCHPK